MTGRQLLEEKNRPVHIIGAGGVGMSGLALLLSQMGYQVSASDKKNSSYLEKLKEAGIQTWLGSDTSKIKKNAILFFSSAIPETDEERSYATLHKIAAFNRHPLIEFITSQYFTIAIAGAHGKTTTAAWLAELLIQAGLDPTALIGGTVQAWQSNFRFGKGMIEGRPILVIEADESDRSFLSIQAKLALITNIDLDHTDQYKNLADVKSAYKDFIKNTLQNSGKILPSLQCFNEVQSWLEEKDILFSKNEIKSCQVAQTNLSIAKKNYTIGPLGLHNAHNAFLVAQVGSHLQIKEKIISEVLQNFSGVGRRMQLLCSQPVKIYDDYAHHPEEVRAVLNALVKKDEKVFVFWEPHRISRFINFYQEFISAFKENIALSQLRLLPCFNAGESVDEFKEFATLWQQFESLTTTAIQDEQELIDSADRLIHYDKIIFLGAGKSSSYAHALCKQVLVTIE